MPSASEAFSARWRQRLSDLVSVATTLSGAETVDELSLTLARHGLAAVGADGGSVLIRDDVRGMVTATLAGTYSDEVVNTYREFPLTSSTPGVWAARTGQVVLLPTLADAVAFWPEMAGASRVTGRHSWACVPLQVGTRLLGALVASWNTEEGFTDEDVDVLTIFAAQCAQTLERVQRREADQVAVLASQRLSEALQRSLLTQPAAPAHLSIAVRYQAAVDDAQVGGDWYDAFVTSTGSTLLAIGDVSGHDRTAAASMGQVRNLVRGMAYDTDDSPARLLSRLDTAIDGLQLDTLATAVLARIEAGPTERSPGARRLRWSNAGHLPPMLRHCDGRVDVLDATADLMLGVFAGSSRSDHTIDLPDDATLLLYTDGLVERRGTPLAHSLTELAELFAEVGGREVDDVCDGLLAALVGEHDVDDVAVLVLRSQRD